MRPTLLAPAPDWLHAPAACIGVLVAALACDAAPGRAQDFAPAEPAGPSASAAALLEHGLPSPGAFRAEALTTSWLGVPGLVTRTMCATFAVRSVRVAAGWSQTGEPGAGWTAAALALGAATASCGVAARAVGRHDVEESLRDDERDGVEVGGGAWLSTRAGFVVWASAPQLVTAGCQPPLPRALAAGVAAERDGLGAWFEREAPARSSDETGTHAAGICLRLGASRVWVEGRGRPLRAGFGMAVGVIGVRVLAHPRLGDTVTLSLAFPARATQP